MSIGRVIALIVVICALLAVGAVGYAAMTRSAPPGSPEAVGRFQIVSAEVLEGIGGDDAGKPKAFLLDTWTGRVWEWSDSYRLVGEKALAVKGWRLLYVEGIEESMPYSQVFEGYPKDR